MVKDEDPSFRLAESNSNTDTNSDTGMVQRLRQNLAESGLDDCPHLLLGFSGGVDSLALLVAMRTLDRLGIVRLAAVHVDHGMRETSADDAEQVLALTARLGVACHVWRIVPEQLARHSGVGVEEALRRERYRGFVDVAERVGVAAVVTAHHQRDQAETVLLHLLRGSGLRGASGMRSVTDLVVPWWEEPGFPATSLRVWRPLLNEPASVLRKVVRDSALRVIEDPSNADLRFRRNAIRHEVLPVLERVMPGAVANLAGFANLAGEDDDVLELLTEEKVREASEGLALRWSSIGNLPVGLQRRILRSWILERAPASHLELSSQRVEAVRRAGLAGQGGVTIQLGSGWVVVVDKGLLGVEQSS